MNFLTEYLNFNSGNEVNEHYHIWSALSAMSAMISRKVWIDQGYFKVYPLLYVVLLGPPGNGKTTAMGIAKKLVRSVGDIPFSAECQSKENLVKLFMTYERQVTTPGGGGTPHVYTPMAVFVTELSQFIGIDPVKMIDFLVTVYDADVYDMSTQKHGLQFINGPFLSMLACTTSDWVTNYLKSDIITGGFSRRAVFVLETWESNKRVPRPIVTPEMNASFAACIQRGNELKQLCGPMSWDPEAAKWYDDWYMKRVLTSDTNVAPFDKTKPTLVIKIAMLLSLAKGNSLVLTLEDLQVALAMLDKIQVQLPSVFSSIGRNELSAVSARCEQILRSAGTPLPMKEVQAKLWAYANTAEQYQVFNYMVGVGTLYQLSISGPTGPRQWLALPEQVAALKELQSQAAAPPASTSEGSAPSVDQPTAPT